MKIKCLIFSKDRAIQLLALLETLHIQCEDINEMEIVVLYKTTSLRFEEQYKELKKRYSNISFQVENNIENDIRQIISFCEYVLFLIDDCICLKSFKILDIMTILIDSQNSIGFSLRLGENISYCYPYACKQTQPVFTKIEKNILQFDWTKSEYDFGYPMDLSSSVYRVSDIVELLKNVKFDSLKYFEAFLSENSSKYKELKPNLLCFDKSRCFSNPLNITAQGPPNRNSAKSEYGIDKMCEKFRDGYKIDITRFSNFIPNGCHEEVDLTWVRR